MGIFKTVYKLVYVMLTATTLACLSGSCKVISAQVMMHRKTPKEKVVMLDEREVRFIPIVHFGQKAFYRKLKEQIVLIKTLATRSIMNKRSGASIN